MKANFAHYRFAKLAGSLFALTCTLLCTTSGTAGAKEALPAGAKVVALEVQPKAIDLANRYQYVQLLLSAKLESGESIDVTRIAEAAAPGNVTLSPTGVVRPQQDGQGEIKFTLAGQSLSLPVKVAGVGTAYQASFVRDVTPALAKMGCSAGTCHGSLNGKAGFKLSLRSYDPLYDHRALTDDIAGRRFNRAAPDQSLMLLKPSGVIPHVGGVLMQPGQPYYEIVRSWIAGGVKLDLESPRVTKIELFPKNPVVPMPGMTQQMAVLATYSDGAMRDVTLESFISSGNTDVAEPDKFGLITTVRRGEAPVLARYEGAYTATTVTVMGDRTGYQWSNPPANNYVDELVYSKLQRVKALPSALCSDAEFIRRVSLDITGLPPTPEALRAFIADPRETKIKRDELVDQLVGNAEYVELWTNKWADMLQVNRKFLGEQGAAALRGWIKQAVASNLPYDKFVYSVLTASGSTLDNPPASYFKVLRSPEDTMENTTQLFMAVRFNCNKCHDHPFERWTQSQYYHLSAYFAQVGRKEDPASAGKKIGGTDVEAAVPLVEDVFDSGSGEVTHLGTGKPAVPQFPFAYQDLAAAAAPRREQLAKWITSKENQYFAKSYVNRLWGYLFGVGIIDPIDDIRAGNPPTNPELLDRLTSEFVASGFNAQQMLRTICKSRTYQTSIVTNQWNKDDEINFSHAIARRLPAEVLYDTIQRATGAESHLPGVPVGFRAAQLPDVGLTLPSGFFELFGRPARESSCECERSSGMMLGPVMTLVNGPTIAEAIADPNNAITKLVSAEKDDAKLVTEIYTRMLCRAPTRDEITSGIAALQGSDDELNKFKAELAAYEVQLDVKQAEWESSQGSTVWQELEPLEMKSAVGATFVKQPDHAVLVEGALGKDLYTIACATDLSGITGIRLEALADPKLPGQGPGRSPNNGNFVLSEIKLSAAPKADPSKVENVGLQNATADFAQGGFPPQNSIDGNPDSGWAIHGAIGKNHTLLIETKQDINIPGGAMLTFTLDQQYADSQHALGKFRLSVTTSRRPLAMQGPPAPIAAILAVPAATRTPEQKAALATHFRSLDTEWVRQNNVVAQATAQSGNKRLVGAQDLAWALINSPSFLFNR